MTKCLPRWPCSKDLNCHQPYHSLSILSLILKRTLSEEFLFPYLFIFLDREFRKRTEVPTFLRPQNWHSLTSNVFGQNKSKASTDSTMLHLLIRGVSMEWVKYFALFVTCFITWEWKGKECWWFPMCNPNVDYTGVYNAAVFSENCSLQLWRYPVNSRSFLLL